MAQETQKQEENKRKYKPLSVIYCIVACVLSICFVVWTGYIVFLLLIPLFIDIYITQFIEWGKWKKTKNPLVRKTMEWVDAILFALIGVYFINTFFFQNYQIPSSSLEKTLLVGDFLCVSKISYGARSPMTPLSLPLMQHTTPFGTKSYLENPKVKYQRFKGTGRVHLDDIVVFNYPSGDSVAVNKQDRDYYVLQLQQGRDILTSHPEVFGNVVYRPVDRRENYVKRCVGMPGDTISFIDDLVYLNGKQAKIPQELQLCYAVQTDGTRIQNQVWEQLGVSDDDMDYVYAEEINLSDPKMKEMIKNGGLATDITNQKNNILYTGVYLTRQKAEELAKKPFVLKVINMNTLKNNLGTKRNMINNPAYPIGYYADKEIPFGYFPPIWIPAKGATINFETDTDYKVAAYERCIKNYEGNDFDYRDGVVYINGLPSSEYTFQMDYFFMSGDNRENSADSRMWGFVPEDHIVGKPLFIWLSLNKDKGWFDGKIRWDRIFTNGNKF